MDIQFYAVIIIFFIYHLKLMKSLKNEKNKNSLFLYSNLKGYTLMFLIWIIIVTLKMFGEAIFNLYIFNFVNDLYMDSIMMYISSYLIIKGFFLIQVFLKKRDQLDEQNYKIYLTKLNKTFILKFNGYIGVTLLLFYVSKILYKINFDLGLLVTLLGLMFILGVMINEFVNFYNKNKNNLT